MKLTPVSNELPSGGDVLVARGLHPQTPDSLQFVIIEKSEANLIYLSPFSAVYDDPDDGEETSSWTIRCERASRHLARATLEHGDPLLHRNRPARILECKANDWHVKIAYLDAQGGEFYGNVVWMDLSPALNLIDLTTAWPTLS